MIGSMITTKEEVLRRLNQPGSHLSQDVVLGSVTLYTKRPPLGGGPYGSYDAVDPEHFRLLRDEGLIRRDGGREDRGWVITEAGTAKVAAELARA